VRPLPRDGARVRGGGARARAADAAGEGLHRGGPGLAAELRISGIPTLALFAGGREVARQAGAMPARRIVEWASRASAGA
jgi:hypothetical protein